MDRKRNGDGFTAGGTGLLARVAPLRRRLRTEAGSAGLLLVATVIALLWANSPFAASYDTFWHTPFAVRFGSTELALALQHWVNHGLMALFFYVVALEVKRELVIGEFADRRQAAVPALAALTGLVVPALIYVAFNLGDEALRTPNQSRVGPDYPPFSHSTRLNRPGIAGDSISHRGGRGQDFDRSVSVR